MDQISVYLSKFDKFGLKEKQLKDQLIKIIDEKIGEQINQNDISIKSNNIYMRVRPIVRSELLLKKSEIEEKLLSNGRKYRLN